MRGEGTRVLVVDDDAGIRQMISIALTAAGYDVDVADGIEPIERRDFAAVVLDRRLGDHSAADLVGNEPWLRDLPIVVITATTSPSDLADDFPTPVAVLTKPFDLEALEAAVAAACAVSTRTSEPDAIP